jgi:Acetyltransferase (GNAT) domain
MSILSLKRPPQVQVEGIAPTTLLTAKSIYHDFCQTELSIPLFLQPWWLDAVCTKGEWDVCLSYDNAGRIDGILPYYQVFLKGVITAIVMPDLTPHAGVWTRLPDADKSKRHSQYTVYKKILDKLLVQLPEVGLYHQKFHYSMEDWQPFYWKGYSQNTHYTYLLENLQDLDTIYKNFKGSVRTDLKKAAKSISVSQGDDIYLFYELCQKSLKKQGASMAYSLQSLVSLDKVLVQKGLRKIYFAYDAEKRCHSAIYVVCYNGIAHYLCGGSDPDLRQSGATYLTLWQAIQDASKMAQVFDFEGSMIPSVEYAFRSFGAVQKPFFRITKAKNRFYEGLTLLFRNYR